MMLKDEKGFIKQLFKDEIQELLKISDKPGFLNEVETSRYLLDV
jgi:hypothetical protein